MYTIFERLWELPIDYSGQTDFRLDYLNCLKASEFGEDVLSSSI